MKKIIQLRDSACDVIAGMGPDIFVYLRTVVHTLEHELLEDTTSYLCYLAIILNEMAGSDSESSTELNLSFSSSSFGDDSEEESGEIDREVVFQRLS